MNDLPNINVPEQEIRDSSIKSKKLIAERKANFYKNGGRGRFSLRTKEEIEHEKAENAKLYGRQRQLETGYITDAYSGIQDNSYKNSFYELESEYQKQATTYNNFKNYAEANGTMQSPVYCTSWLNWVQNTKQQYNYELVEEYIIYNEEHFAVWNEDPIYILNDYRIYADGHYARLQFFSDGKGAKSKKKCLNVIKKYSKLFVNMLPNKPFEYYLWSIMEFTRQTIEINNFVISPFEVYQVAASVYYTKSRTEKKVYPKLNKRRHKKLYLEAGFEKEGKEAYKLYKEFKKEEPILQYIKTNTKDGLVDVDQLMFALGMRRVVKVEHKTCYNEFGSYSSPDSIAYVKLLNKRKVVSLVNKVIKEHPELGEVKLKRKKQSRSEWHDLVKEGKTYKEVLEVFPEVKYNAYKQFKHRIKE